MCLKIPPINPSAFKKDNYNYLLIVVVVVVFVVVIVELNNYRY